MNDESLMPRRKVTAGGLGGAVAVIAIGILDRLGAQVTPVEAGALSVIFSFLTAYFVSE